MESIASISTSIILPPTTTISVSTSRSVLIPLPPHRCSPLSSAGRRISIPRRRHFSSCKSSASGGGGGGGGLDKQGGEEEEREEVEKALHLDGTIPGTSDEFVRQVSSRAYDMRRKLEQTFDSTSYDVLESNPWRGDSKPVYVLTQRENQICTMKTRTTHSEVEKELGLLFSKRISNQKKQSRSETKFDMLVEDVRDGVLVFEDVNEAVRYCDLLQGGGKGCEGVAEIEASSVFDLCRKTRSLAVLFRRGRTPPTPQTLERNLGSRKRSLEDLRDNE
ncbi:hypothetical protein HID58_021476 [Brassica napus]|uniref:Uncharacterized protein n=1 Tax=Brassica napus TaxID=3708 RepID=A0ABQ8CY29_BRANA|nr:uncharacterized protein LOC106346539 [Brassica napus]KAH0921458.1 hypothetical protein HID58_021476 [Brassica napus]